MAPSIPNKKKTVRILGTHGVPAAYGGFETAAENIAIQLVARGWHVVVYCQVFGSGPIVEDLWNGIERVLIAVDLPGALGTSKFDWLATAHACRFADICLTFGYNTGLFALRQRLSRIPHVINMDGIEWSRSRWGWLMQSVLYVNEKLAALFGNVLIADHPEITKYLQTFVPSRKIATIAYGADPVPTAPSDPVLKMGLAPSRYLTLISRLIPENSIFEIVRGFSAQPRNARLVVLGEFEPQSNPYHRLVAGAASPEVLFAGAIYDKNIVQALRFHGAGYMHGHTVGGTNPSLVEAMAAGNPVIARDNSYNRWVADQCALYFTSLESVDACVDRLLSNPDLQFQLKAAAVSRHAKLFTWDHIAGQYEQLLLSVFRD